MFASSIVLVDWGSASVVSLYKSKGDMCECSCFRGMSLLSVVSKVFGRVMIKRIRDGTDVICYWYSA